MPPYIAPPGALARGAPAAAATCSTGLACSLGASVRWLSVGRGVSLVTSPLGPSAGVAALAGSAFSLPSALPPAEVLWFAGRPCGCCSRRGGLGGAGGRETGAGRR